MMIERIRRFKIVIHNSPIIDWVKNTPIQWCVLETIWDNFNQKETDIEVEYENGDIGIYSIEYFRRNIT